jgi:pilA1
MISSNKTKGFTLVELLIVIVVIAILAAISIVAYNGVTQKARDDERASDARNIINAAASYHADNDKWPTDSEIRGYNTIKLSDNAKSGIGSTEPDSGTNKGKYKYEQCSTGTPASVTGAKVTYWKDVLGQGETDHKIVLKTGEC